MNDDVLLDAPDWVAKRLFWTEERERQLRTMLTFHRMSCVEMARALGTSKNAICGKTKRMGLSTPVTPRDDSDAARNRRLDRRNELALARRLARKHGPPPPPPRPLWKPRHRVAEPAQGVFANPVSIIDLTPTTCRWPLWSDRGWAPDKMYCGDVVVAGEVYCATHLAMTKRPKGER